MANNQAREGLSLSSITEIAANPPDAFDEQDAGHLQQLVLYIARVPGRRDVFLTTLKPRRKVVTAEDVQSCLYYVHADHADDNLEPEVDRSDEGMETHLHPYSQSYHTHSDQLSGPPNTDYTRHIPFSAPRTISRKPLNHQQNISRKSVPQPLKLLPVDETSGARLNQHPLPALPLEPVGVPRVQSHSQTITTASVGVASVLTLIRRDPGTNLQWNVARILDPLSKQSPEADSIRTRTSQKKKFRALQEPLHLDIVNENYGRFNRESPSGIDNVVTQGVFQRSVQVPMGAFGRPRDNPEMSESSSPVPHVWFRREVAQNQPIDPPPVHSFYNVSGRNGPAFFSPWGELCEFVTGITGKSLKCRVSRTDAGLSELRFNLPMTSYGEEQMRADRASDTHTRRRSSKPKRWSMQRPPSALYNDHNCLDLSLAREKAGGGFGGKQAKLGKLIIERSGLKMLDLLVAANVGLWWRIFEGRNEQ